MAKLDEVLARIDVATNAVAAKLDALAATLATDMSAADVAAAQTHLSAIADHLEAMGKTADNPVPTPVPEPTPPA